MLVKASEIATEQRQSSGSGRLAASARLAVVILGIVVGQAVLYGPSLVGKKILLPLDLLAEPGVYLPRTPEMAGSVPHDVIRSDLVFFYEPERQFANSELRAGRFPLWTPHRYAGAPCFRLSFSPAWLLAYAVASPVVLAWTQMLIALIAGLGAYAFFRGALKLGFWPSAIVSACYPLTGSFIIWQGYWQPAVFCWLGWMLLAVDSVVRRPRGWGGPGLALVTMLALVSGAADNAGQMLLASGLYAIGCVISEYGCRQISRPHVRAMGMASAGWAVGIIGALWLLLPMIQYINTGVRASARSQGREERPPVGLLALPQVVLPEIYGSTHSGSFRTTNDNVQESSVGAYAGLLAALVLVPLAWCSRRHRSANIILLILIFVSQSWQMNVPGMVDLLRLPGLNMMSHNRFVFVASFAVLAMAAIGLDAMWNRSVARGWWMALPAVVLLGIGSWCVYRAFVLPEPVATQLGQMIQRGQTYPTVRTVADVARVQASFSRSFAVAGAVSLIGLVVFVRLYAGGRPRAWLGACLGVCLVGELLWFGWGRSGQCEPALYYPRVPILDQIAHRAPGRIIAFNCFPANLAQSAGLYDVRGYDGVDPARLMELLKPMAAPGSSVLPYAITQWLTPVVNVLPSGGCQLSPVLDMLGVRYVICRGSAPQGIKPELSANDYWALVNARALPRAYIPQRVETIADAKYRLPRILAPDFDPRSVAFVERPIDLPVSCKGSATILSENPTRVTIALDMQTPGLLVLADQWDPAWKARLDGKGAPVLQTNHVLRGVVVPPGKHTLEFRCESGSLRWGAGLSLAAALGWMSWVGLTVRASRGHARPDPLIPAVISDDPKARHSKGSRHRKRRH